MTSAGDICRPVGSAEVGIGADQVGFQSKGGAREGKGLGSLGQGGVGGDGEQRGSEAQSRPWTRWVGGWVGR